MQGLQRYGFFLLTALRITEPPSNLALLAQDGCEVHVDLPGISPKDTVTTLNLDVGVMEAEEAERCSKLHTLQFRLPCQETPTQL